jgi:hypothetical protein
MGARRQAYQICALLPEVLPRGIFALISMITVLV